MTNQSGYIVQVKYKFIAYCAQSALLQATRGQGQIVEAKARSLQDQGHDFCLQAVLKVCDIPQVPHPRENVKKCFTLVICRLKAVWDDDINVRPAYLAVVKLWSFIC